VRFTDPVDQVLSEVLEDKRSCTNEKCVPKPAGVWKWEHIVAPSCTISTPYAKNR
jgi:hypothetical protein